MPSLRALGSPVHEAAFAPQPTGPRATSGPGARATPTPPFLPHRSPRGPRRPPRPGRLRLYPHAPAANP